MQKEPYYDEPNKLSIYFKVCSEPTYRPKILPIDTILKYKLLPIEQQLGVAEAINKYIQLMKSCWEYNS